MFVCLFVCLVGGLFGLFGLFVCLWVCYEPELCLAHLPCHWSCSGRRRTGRSQFYANSLQTRTVNAFDDDPTLSRFLSINSPARNPSVRSLISSSWYLDPLSANLTSSCSASFWNSMSSLAFRAHSLFFSWSFIFTRWSSHLLTTWML